MTLEMQSDTSYMKHDRWSLADGRWWWLMMIYSMIDEWWVMTRWLVIMIFIIKAAPYNYHSALHSPHPKCWHLTWYRSSRWFLTEFRRARQNILLARRAGELPGLHEHNLRKSKHFHMLLFAYFSNKLSIRPVIQDSSVISIGAIDYSSTPLK